MRRVIDAGSDGSKKKIVPGKNQEASEAVPHRGCGDRKPAQVERRDQSAGQAKYRSRSAGAHDQRMPPQACQAAGNPAGGVGEQVGPTVKNPLRQAPQVPQAPHVEKNVQNTDMQVIRAQDPPRLGPERSRPPIGAPVEQLRGGRLGQRHARTAIARKTATFSPTSTLVTGGRGRETAIRGEAGEAADLVGTSTAAARHCAQTSARCPKENLGNGAPQEMQLAITRPLPASPPAGERAATGVIMLGRGKRVERKLGIFGGLSLDSIARGLFQIGPGSVTTSLAWRQTLRWRSPHFSGELDLVARDLPGIFNAQLRVLKGNVLHEKNVISLDRTFGNVG